MLYFNNLYIQDILYIQDKGYKNMTFTNKWNCLTKINFLKIANWFFKSFIWSMSVLYYILINIFIWYINTMLSSINSCRVRLCTSIKLCIGWKQNYTVRKVENCFWKSTKAIRQKWKVSMVNFEVTSFFPLML